jgi:hypothetical protein
MSHYVLNTLYINANTTIKDLYEWLCANKVALKANKTNYIVINPKRTRCNFAELKVSIPGKQLEIIGISYNDWANRFLGIYLDELLTKITCKQHNITSYFLQ